MNNNAHLVIFYKAYSTGWSVYCLWGGPTALSELLKGPLAYKIYKQFLALGVYKTVPLQWYIETGTKVYVGLRQEVFDTAGI